MVGVRRDDVFQNMSGYGLFTGGLGIHFGAERLGCMTIPAGPGNSRRQIKLAKDFKTTVAHILPSYALILGEHLRNMGEDPRDFPLRIAVVGAEPYTVEFRRRIEELFDMKAYNSYGLSEMNGPGVAFECQNQNGLHVWEDAYLPEIVDPKTGEPVPDGEIGEICVKGPILALGYYNSREKTAESFLQNPLNHAYDERIYKTGDLGHFAPDGNLMFHGRKDRQVKHLGHRVELGEIDLAAAKVPGVEEACALYDQEHEQIWLFYTGADVTKRDIAVALRADLPGFMVPRKIEQLEAMPRLDNGKTDMRALAGRIADAHR